MKRKRCPVVLLVFAPAGGRAGHLLTIAVRIGLHLDATLGQNLYLFAKYVDINMFILDLAANLERQLDG